MYCLRKRTVSTETKRYKLPHVQLNFYVYFSSRDSRRWLASISGIVFTSAPFTSHHLSAFVASETRRCLCDNGLYKSKLILAKEIKNMLIAIQSTRKILCQRVRKLFKIPRAFGDTWKYYLLKTLAVPKGLSYNYLLQFQFKTWSWNKYYMMCVA